MELLDIAIVGAGPAGLTAGIYGIRTGRSVTLFERLSPGGQAAATWQVDNYPGLPHINGAELMMHMENQARDLGLSIVSEEAAGLVPGSPLRLAIGGREVACRSLILAMGASPRPLGIPGEAEFRGKGVSYCATCDAAFFRNLPVAVVGGGNTALEEAEFLTRFASKVYLVHRRPGFRADKILQDHVLAMPKIEVVTPYTAVAIQGEGGSVAGLEVQGCPGESRRLEVKGVFIFTGVNPQTDPFRTTLDADGEGYLRTNDRLMTSVAGVFAAGDCRSGSIKQIITAAAEGATAAIQADRFLQTL